MEVLSLEDSRFKKYGKVLTGYDFTELCRAMDQTPVTDQVVYEPSVSRLEHLPIAEEFQRKAYGGLPVQIGYCCGKNRFLNAVEYHKTSELNIAVTDMVLMLGCQQDIEDDDTYDTSRMEMFRIPAGAGVELYATTLHYAPCDADGSGFKTVVVLPRGTNFPLSESQKAGKDRLLAASNKWLIAHAQSGLDAFIGLKGENLSISYESESKGQ